MQFPVIKTEKVNFNDILQCWLLLLGYLPVVPAKFMEILLLQTSYCNILFRQIFAPINYFFMKN